MRRLGTLLVLTACTGGGPARSTAPLADFGGSKATQVGRYKVGLEVSPNPPALGELFEVTAVVTLDDGTPLQTAALTLDARMPQHEHGMETLPRVDEGVCSQPDDTDSPRRCTHPGGRYRARGFKFHMSGKWTMMVSIDGPAGPDSTTFIYDMP